MSEHGVFTPPDDAGELIKERRETHGDPTLGHELMWRLLQTLFPIMEESSMHLASRWELIMNVYKHTRLINKPKVKEHYRDARGYLKLVEDREKPTD